MVSPFEFMMAGRYLRARKAEGFVSVIAGFSFLGIMLGVATLIIVMSVMNGFRYELISRILGLNGHLSVYNSTPLQDYNVMALHLSEIEGVESVSPLIESQVLVTVNGHASGAMVRGMRAVDFAHKPIISTSITSGNMGDFTDGNVAIGVKMAQKYGLIVGDPITLLAPKGKAGPFGTIPRSRTFKIAMIFDVGMFEYDSSFVFMPLDSAQIFFQMPEGVSSLEIITKDPAHVADVRRRVATAIDGEASVYDWRDMNGSFFTALQVERNVMFLILTMIILVAAFNIISSMIMLVKDKGRDIAIMRTMGATRGSMMRIFMMTGASIGLVGTAVGALAGIMFALNIESIRQWIQSLSGTDLFSEEIYFLSKLPAIVEWEEVIVIIGMAFTLSILATIYPAWRAARLDPVEALRYE
ncbi:MAG: lipoprotein-releasing ABC transporter permease subunit [Micavibrio sp.]